MKASPSSDYPFKWLPDGTPVERPAEPAPDPDQRHRRAAWLIALEWGLLVVAAIVIALVIKTFLFQAFYIPSESMSPTLEKNDRVIVNKLSYKLHAVHRGDIIVFKAPPGVDDPGVKDLVKRVIGLPGETVEGRSDGHVYINGKRLNEPYLNGVRTDPGFARITVPKDEYWVMGDNRPNSRDSRYFPQHFITKHDIVGRVFVRVWPLNRIDLL